VAARPPVVATPRISLTHQVIMPYAPIVETRTVVGLNLGRMNSCLAFTRAQGDRLLALPSMVPFDGQTLLPTVVVLKDAAPALMGRAALRNYVLNPESVTANFINTPQLAERQAAALAFLKAVCARLTEVTGAGRQQTLHISLGNPLTQESGSTKLLVEWINQTGMQVDQVVPEPLAVLAAFLQQQKLKPLAAGEMQHILVLDGGSSSFRVACVERLDNGELTVIDNQELLPAGPGFDQILWEWLTRRLPAQPDDQTLRELALFTQDFKVQMSRSFAHGKAEHAQFCMLTGQASPLHITIRREEFEQMAAPLLEQLSTALSEAPARIGLQCSDIAYILLAGGGAGWYFLPEMVQKTMCQAPLKEAHPEETIARGLAVYGLKG
jgi:molecular chaperone DnaK (HSP70)